MNQNYIRKVLRMHDCKVWQLCDKLGCSRDHYYQLAHRDFKGHEKTIQNGLNAVILSADKKAGVAHAN